VDTDYERWKPLHWALAVPDVMERGGFDAVIGNPPFLGGQKLTGSLGTNMRDWFVNVIASGRRGSADLVAYFFLRAFGLLGRNGGLGLIATNTIAQGDSRMVGLDQIVAGGFTITRSIQSRNWPARSANLEYAAVWGTRSEITPQAARTSDGKVVPAISTLLEPAGAFDGDPQPLTENLGGSFQGCIVLGMGFVLDPLEAERWMEEDPRNSEVVFPWLGGKDLYQRPSGKARRWIIDFSDRTEEAARSYALPYERVLLAVKEERQRQKRKQLRERWWQYAEKRPALREAISTFSEVLAIVQTSKGLMPLRVSTRQVLDQQLIVIATDSYADQAVLSSSIHTNWALKYGTTLRTDPVYVASAVYDTFPMPGVSGALAELGKTLDDERRDMMLRLNLGLTKLYNRVNSPGDSGDRDIARLRAIHAELDEAVMAAYGWGDVSLDHGFHTYRQMERWTVSPAARVEILDRLLEENHRRAALPGKEVSLANSEDSDDE
jgi:hypothetical protein